MVDSAAAMPDVRAFPPGPPERPRGVVRNLPYYVRFYMDSLGFVKQRFDRYGDLYYAPSGTEGLYVLRDPEHVREVLITKASSFSKQHTSFQQLSEVLGAGLLTTDGDTWRRQRRLVQPAFAQTRLVSYARTMVDESERTRDAWPNGAVRDVGVEMMGLTLRVVCRTLFGHDVRGDTDVVRASMQTLQSMVPLANALPRWLPNPARTRFDRAVASLDRVMYGLIAQRRASGAGEHDDLLDMLLRVKDDEGDGGGLSETEIRDQLLTLFLAGHETTSNVLTWTLLLLAQNPDAEAALHHELDTVLEGRTPTYDDLERLPLTERIISEAMRLYPPVYAVGRRAAEDTSIGGFPVRAGSEIMIWMYWMHRDPKIWPNPDAFRPERFAPEEVAKRPKNAYLPFGAGPRACIGKSFAMIEARLLLATITGRHRFRLEPGQTVKPHTQITLSPKGGLKMRVERRSGRSSN